MTQVLPHTAERAAFPLGGIGTGTVCLGARGELRDWELENGPDKGRVNPYSFFAIHAQSLAASPERENDDDEKPCPPALASPPPAVTRVLEARLTGPHDLDAGYPFERVAGLPRLAAATMTGRYPVADIDFRDDDLPVQVRLRAFTPLVPLDPDDSGIPGAVLRYEVTNPTDAPTRVTIAGSMSHVAGRGDGPGGMRARQSVTWRDDGTVRGLDFGVDLPPTDPGYGTLSLTTTDTSTTAKPQWSVGFWPDGSRLFWNDFAADGLLDPETRATREDRPRGVFAEQDDGRESYSEAELLELLPRLRTGSLGIVHTLEPGETRAFEFALAWSFPNRHRGWGGHIVFQDPNWEDVVVNHYATRWPTAWDAAVYLHTHRARLEASTAAFVDALYAGSLDPVIADAVGANIAAARSTTVFVVETPNPELGAGAVLTAWEGSFDHGGSCEGTCTHVWSYAQTLAWLFPSLERSARRVEYLLETDDDGAQKFRSNRIFGGPAWFMGPAVDGQLGTFLRLHREWRFSGDDAFLREVWPAARRSLEYAGRSWDRDGDGLLDGELHNTYDIEFFGIEPLANSLYLAALLAGATMADHLGEPGLAARWRERAGLVAAGMDRVLWNGEYYRQVIDDVDAHRYQYGNGVLSDQLLGQFHAFLAGLGPILPLDHVRSALRAILEHNLRDDLTRHESTQRVYALGEEGGLLLASWPRGGRPDIPFVYSDEVWTGIEHQVATTLAFAGLPSEALRVERLVRARYDGVARNPWNEIECGNHYARSLASWGLLLAFSGAQWDAPTGVLAFDPIGSFRGLFTTGSAWGVVEIDDATIRIRVDGGELDVERLLVRGSDVATSLHLTAGQSDLWPLANHTATPAETIQESP